MNFKEYLNKFDQILSDKTPVEPYNDPAFFNYTKLNQSRLNRWLKKGELSKELEVKIKSITEKQTWIVITEPWCGDAAHNVGFLHKIAELNPNITLDLHLRDEEPSLIDDYLTNGSKSIPKLVVRNDRNEDVFVWGPRPESIQNKFIEAKNAGVVMDEIKIKLQDWYNEDGGQSLQKELLIGLN